MTPSDFIKIENCTFEDILENSKDVTTYDVDIPVVQSNKLAQESSFAVSYIEYRILMTLLAVIEREGDFTKWYKFYIPALARLSNCDIRSLRKTLEVLGDCLKDNQIFITSEDTDEIICLNWLSSIYFGFKTGYVCVRINPALAEWTTELKEHYMKEKLCALICYTRYAASILHGFFCSKFNYSTSRMNADEMSNYIKEITISIESLKFILSNPKKVAHYDNTYSFLTRVLTPALAEINERKYYNVVSPPEEQKTCQVDKPLFRVNKNGKTITKITFFVGAGENNTRVAEQKLIDVKEEEKQKEKKRQIEGKEKKTFNINEGSDRELIDAILKAIPKGQLQELLQKATTSA